MLLFLGAQPSQAVIKLVSRSSYLRTVPTDPTTKEVTVFAGRTEQTRAGLGTAAEDCTVNNPTFTDNTQPCNSCAKLSGIALGLSACNSAEIYPNLPFQITLSSDAVDDYGSCSAVISGRVVGQTTSFAPVTPTTPITPGRANQNVTATFTWSQLCGAKDSTNSNCKKSFNEKFEFSFDRSCNGTLQTGGPQVRIVMRSVVTSPPMTFGCGAVSGPAPAAFEGICNFAVIPGDGKIFIRNTEGVTANSFEAADLSLAGSDGSTKDPSGMKYSALRMYSSAGSVPSQMTYADPFTDLAIAGTELSETRVQKLVNGQPYFFVGAMVDQGGNVSFFTPLANAQQGTPEQVFGLLDNKGCFIATAAYGTPQAKEIKILREFRDVHLAKTAAGRAFIGWYYQNSPDWAATIRDHEMLRGMVRAFLGPLIGMAELSLRYGAWIFYLTLVSIFTLGLAGVCYLGFWSRRSGVTDPAGQV